jgi:hypothetical protein
MSSTVTVKKLGLLMPQLVFGNSLDFTNVVSDNLSMVSLHWTILY